MSTGFLKVKGTKIVDGNDKPIVLKGCGLGGHLNMENFITGYPGHETEFKKQLAETIGQEKTDFFFDKFYDYFWSEKDAEFYVNELKLNCLRIPFNYRHFIDDDGDMFKLNPKGFERLDNIINSCSKYGIYTILDLHTTPGGQNQDWHSDSGVHKSLFWDFKIFQDIIVNLWVELAKYYKDNTYVAGYNPLNEPAVADHSQLVNYYARLEKEIRKVDPNHILYLDGNTYAMDFRQFPSTPLPNSVYSIHDYTVFGFPNPENTLYTSSDSERAKLLQQYNRKVEFMKEAGVPVWNGEFGPVYASEIRGDANHEEINKARYQVLKDQLEIYKAGDPSGDKAPISWTIWLYKDIGYQALTYVDPKSVYFKVFGKFLQKKKKLGLDRWGNDIDPEYLKLYTDLEDHIKANIPEKFHKKLYPQVWEVKDYLSRVSRDILFSRYALFEYVELYEGLSFEELDELAACFKFENVCQRKELNDILKEY